MNLPSPATSAWWRDKILPIILTASIMAVAGTGIAIWRELAVISVKLDQFSTVQVDHEQRLRYLESKDRKYDSVP